jgi:hypothetical protein
VNVRVAVLAWIALGLVAAAPLARAQVPPGYDGAWRQMLPDGRRVHGAALDPTGRKLYLYGGEHWTLTDDFLGYDLDPALGAVAWHRLPSTGVPGPARIEREVLAWDSRRHRLMEFAGIGDHPVADSLWVFDPAGAGAWMALATQGTSPGARTDAAADYDSVADALVLYGGDRGAGDPTWLYTLSFTTDPPTWSARPTGGDAHDATSPGCIFVQASPHRLLRVAGHAPDGRDQVQVESLPLDAPGTWTVLDTTSDGPRDRVAYPAAFDPVHRRLFVAPDAIEKLTRLDVWEFDLDSATGWRELALPAGKTRPHAGHRLLFDAGEDRLLLSGGRWTNAAGISAYDADAWALDPDAGTGFVPLLGPSVVSPAPRTESASAVDRAHRRYYVFGGAGDAIPNGTLGDLWSLDFTNAPRWREESSTTPAPHSRYGAAGAFDSRRGHFLVLGGWFGNGLLGDVLAFDTAAGAWAPLNPLGPAPTPRAWATAVYDSVRDRVLLFGGYDGSPRNDVWALELADTPRWRELHPTTGSAPDGRLQAAAVFDAGRRSLWIYGGYALDGAGYEKALGDSWRLVVDSDECAWSPLDTPDRYPSPRASAGAAYDPVRDRIVYLWGANSNGLRRTDTIDLNLGGVPRWGLLGLLGIEPYPRAEPMTFWDDRHDRMFLFGGSDGNGAASDLWELTWSPPRASPPVPVIALDARVRPNPSAAGVAIEFALSAPATVTCSLFDLAGRELRTLAHGTYPAGPVALAWDGSDDRGARVGPGVYWSRLVVGQGTRSFQVVLLR